MLQNQSSVPTAHTLDAARADSAKCIDLALKTQNISNAGFQLFIDNLVKNKLYRAVYHNQDYTRTVYCTINNVNDGNSAALVSIA